MYVLYRYVVCIFSGVPVQYNGGLLPDIIPVDPIMLFPSRNPFKCHEEVLYLQPLIPPSKRFEFFSPLTGGCSEGLGALCISLNNRGLGQQ